MNENVVFFTAHKCASMFLFRLCMDLAETLKLTLHSPNGGERFSEQDLNDPSKWVNKRGVFGPMRKFCALPFLDQSAVVLHLRDPRDALTSMYYSVAFSHPQDKVVDEIRDQTRAITIDEFAFSPLIKGETPANFYLLRYENYLKHLLHKPGVAFVTYEDLIDDRQSWLRRALEPLHLPNSEETIARLNARYDDEFTIDNEDMLAHKRQIKSGDHRRKLKPQTIERLNEVYKEILPAFGYRF